MNEDAEDLPERIASKRFEYSDDKSYKFWTIELDGTLLTTRFGRIGSSGQTREVRLNSIAMAKRDYLRRIAEKLKAGYQERVTPEKKRLASDEIWERLAEHEPFLQAILTEPDEIDGYAIYADWLSEQHDSLGEFTRLQLALEDPNLAMYRRPKIENGAKGLQLKHAREWLGSLAPWLMDAGLASHGYRFFRGQLSAIRCQVLGLKFADELRRSPHCRILRELAVCSSEELSEDLVIGDQTYLSGRDYGVATLMGGDFRNLREFSVGVVPDEWIAGQCDFRNVTSLIELVATMPRLERLSIGADINLERLLQLELPHLQSLHLALKVNQIGQLEESGIISKIREFGIHGKLSNAMVEQLVEIPGFDQLTEFGCSEVSTISVRSQERLKKTGVVLRVLAISN
ncbi:MAG: WGR domain-containing protein [Rubripirellula sp.]